MADVDGGHSSARSCEKDGMSEEDQGRLGLLLSKSGLSRHFNAFKKEKVTVELIPMLSQADFENLGVKKVGERILLLSLAKAQEKEARLSAEMRTMFQSGSRVTVDNEAGPSKQSSESSISEGLFSRAEQICKQLRPGKTIKNRKNSSKPYKRVANCKVVQKGLVLICFQDGNTGDIIPLKEQDKIYDGCIRYRSDSSEDEIRDEIVRLVRQKESDMYSLALLSSNEFDFVKCQNRKIRQIDGDTPFDGNGISHVYKNGSIYIRLNSRVLEILSQDDNCGIEVEEQIVEEQIVEQIVEEPIVEEPIVEGQIAVSDDDELPSASMLFQNKDSTIRTSFSTTQASLMQPTTTLSSFDLDGASTSYSSSDELQRVLELSKETALLEAFNDKDQQCPSQAQIMSDLTKHIKTYRYGITVRRAHVLDDALKIMKRMSFDPTMSIDIEFLGEQGYDTGGLKREFFRLVGYQTFAYYFENTGCLKHNSVALQEGVYYRLGQLFGMAIIHGGAAMCYMCESVFNFLSGMKPCDIVVGIDEIPIAHIRDMLIKVQSVNTVEELRQILIDNIDLFTECGFIRIPSRLLLGEKADLIQSVSLHFVILKTLGELTQFQEGIETLGIRRAMCRYRTFLKDFYVMKEFKLTADCVRKIFKAIEFSEKGSNAREKEETTYMIFLDYLHECERESNVVNINDYIEDVEDELQTMDNKRHVSLTMLMIFFTGAEEIPPMGYLYEPELNFSPISPYPTSSTCALQLTLPTCYVEYGPFRDAMDTALLTNGGFGLS